MNDLLLIASQEMRRIFSSRLETVTDKFGFIIATPAKAQNSSRGNTGWGARREGNRYSRDGQKSFGQLGGEYLHLTLYKENKDTMDALNLIARMLKIKVQNFGFSGTKDRRAGTVQRVSIHRQRAHNLVWLNSRMTGVKVGDFRHSKYPLQLGQHAGNEFIITLKNCQHYRGANCSTEVRIKMLQESVEMGLQHVYKHGFINYFGLQRFGTHSIGTHELGMKILKGDFEGAIEDILHVDPQAMTDMLSENHPHGYGPMNDTAANRDETNRARAIASWKATGNGETALNFLPKRFGAETSIIRHLSREGQRRDYMGALLSITRGMRQMYIHAYQSFVWNFVATRRWSQYGSRVIEGDLILLDTQALQDMNDGDDDDVLDPSTDWENFYAQVRPLTAQDIASGAYTIFDIVLPTPGYDVIYPNNEIGEFYKTFMEREENGALDPYDMRRRHKEFSLSGSYRPIVARLLQKPEYIIRAYSDDNEQMYPTDIDLILQKKAESQKDRKRKIEGEAVTGSRWADFAKNVDQHDKAYAEEVIRRDAEAPSVPGGGNMAEKWIETGVDGVGKRLKIARHEDITREAPSLEQNTEMLEAPTAPSEQEAKSTFPGPKFSGTEMTGMSGPAAPANGEPVRNQVLAALTGYTVGKGPNTLLQPLLKETLNQGGPATNSHPPGGPAVNGVAEVASAGAGANTMTHGSVSAENASITPGSSTAASDAKPAGFFANSSGHRTPTTAGFQGLQSPMGKLAVSSSQDQPAQAPLAVPEFQQLSDNTISAFAPGGPASTGNNHGDGKKIAVVLKFQLRSSSYATIVLRELMGTIREENTRGSRGTTPGPHSGGLSR